MLFNEGTEVEATVEAEVETEVETETEEGEEQEEQKSEKTERRTETLEQKEARLSRQLEQTRKKLGKDSEIKTQNKSGDLDYGQKAFLIANGIKDAKEVEFIKKEMKTSGLELDALLENGYFMQRFTEFQSLNKTAQAVPKGTRGAGVDTGSVEFWATKPIEEVPQDMRIKVVNYKLSKETVS